MTYLNAKKFIRSMPKEISASRLIPLLDAIGSPQKRLKYIRLVGVDNASVCAEIIRCTATKAGYTVGCLHTKLRPEHRENISVGMSPISMEEFSANVSSIREIIAKESLEVTESELMVAVAFAAFRRAGCELCIIDSDMSDLSCTKLLPPPFATVICDDLTHKDKETLSNIRTFICRGTKEVMCFPQSNEAAKAITDACYGIGCRLTFPSKPAISVYKTAIGGSEFSYRDKLYFLGICGRFQVTSAALCIDTVEMLNRQGYTIRPEAVRDGLSEVRMSEKFEVISVSPLIIVSYAHSQSAMEDTCSALEELMENRSNSLRLCLPRLSFMADYSSAFSGRKYDIEGIYTLTPAAEDDEYLPCVHVQKNMRGIVNAALKGLPRDTVLLLSGDSRETSELRYFLLNNLGF